MLHRAHISRPMTTPAEALGLVQRAVDAATSLDNDPSEGTILNQSHSMIYAAIRWQGFTENEREILQAGGRYSEQVPFA